MPTILYPTIDVIGKTESASFYSRFARPFIIRIEEDSRANALWACRPDSKKGGAARTWNSGFPAQV